MPVWYGFVLVLRTSGRRGRRLLAIAAAVSAALIAVSPAAEAAPTPPTVTVGALTAKVFQNPTDSGGFTATPSTPVEFTQSFPVLNFDPPSGSVTCSNSTGVDETTRPFTDVVPQPNGTCATIVVQGNGEQAGVANASRNDLSSFEMAFSTTLTVSAAGQVTFNFFSDDGWVMGIGTGPGSAQPTYVSGPRINAPSTAPFSGFHIVGSYNQASAPTRNDLVVDFPAAGTYPVELDYTECCGGQLSFTLQANGTSIPPAAAVTMAKTADSATAVPGGHDGYTVTLTNGTTTPATVTSVTDTLPSGFSYLTGSTTGAITADPAASGSQLTWSGSFTVPAGASLTFHFGVTVSSTAGHYTNSVTASAGSASVTPATGVAPIDVATVVATPLFPLEGLPIALGIAAAAGCLWRRRRLLSTARASTSSS